MSLSTVLTISCTFGGYVPYRMLSLPKSSEMIRLCEFNFLPESRRLIDEEARNTEVEFTGDCVEQCQLTIRTRAPRNGTSPNICYLNSPISTQPAIFGLHLRSRHKWSSLKQPFQKTSKSKRKRISYSYYDDDVYSTFDNVGPMNFPFHG